MDEAEGDDLEVVVAVPSSFHGRTYAGKGVLKRLARGEGSSADALEGRGNPRSAVSNAVHVTFRSLSTYIIRPYV